MRTLLAAIFLIGSTTLAIAFGDGFPPSSICTTDTCRAAMAGEDREWAEHNKQVSAAIARDAALQAEEVKQRAERIRENEALLKAPTTPANAETLLSKSYKRYIGTKACSRPGYTIGYLSYEEMESARTYMGQIERKLAPLVPNKDLLWKYASATLDDAKKTVELWSNRAASMSSATGYSGIHDRCLGVVNALRQTAESLGADTTDPKDF